MSNAHLLYHYPHEIHSADIKKLHNQKLIRITSDDRRRIYIIIIPKIFIRRAQRWPIGTHYDETVIFFFFSIFIDAITVRVRFEIKKKINLILMISRLPTLFTHLYLWLIVTSIRFSGHNKHCMAPIKKIPKHACIYAAMPIEQTLQFTTIKPKS